MKFNQKLINHVPTQMSYFSGFNFPSMRKILALVAFHVLMLTVVWVCLYKWL